MLPLTLDVPGHRRRVRYVRRRRLIVTPYLVVTVFALGCFALALIVGAWR